MLQSQGLTALGSAGGALGYTGATLTTPGVAPSAGIGFNIYTGGQSGGSSLYQLSGGIVTTSLSTTNSFTPSTSVNLDSGDPIQVNISYDGSNNFIVSLSDSTAGSSYATIFSSGDLASVVGSSAYVGFSGADGGTTSTQKISNFRLKPTPGAYTNVLLTHDGPFRSPPSTLDLASNSQTVGSLASAGTVTNLSAASLSVLTAGGDNSSQTFSGNRRTVVEYWACSRRKAPAYFDAYRIEQRLLGRHDCQQRHSAVGQWNNEERRHDRRHPQ